MRPLSCLASALALACALGSAGCSFTEDVPARSNGESKVLLFEGPQGTSPLGASRTVSVTRDTGGTQDCTLGSRAVASGGLHPTGGSLSGPEHCGPVQKDSAAYSLESAACDAGACTITEDAASAQLLHVAATPAAVAAGARVDARLRVTLKSKADGALYTDTFVLRFARAARIRLHNGIDSPLPLLSPMLPGVELRMPTAAVVDDAGKALELEPGTLVVPSPGDLFSPASDSSYETRHRATRPGRARLTWELPGVIARSLDVEVVDPSTTRSLVVLAPRSDVARRERKQDLDEALATPEAPATETLEDTAGRPIFGEVRVLLADGRTAITVLDAVETDRPSEAECVSSESSFELYRQGKAGVAGTVTVRAAGLTRTVPFVLAP